MREDYYEEEDNQGMLFADDPSNEEMYDNQKSEKTLWTVLGFFFPLIVSVILYFVWRNEKPVRANAIIKGMVIGLITGAIFAVITIGGYFVLARFAMPSVNYAGK